MLSQVIMTAWHIPILGLEHRLQTVSNPKHLASELARHTGLTSTKHITDTNIIGCYIYLVGMNDAVTDCKGGSGNHTIVKHTN